MRGLLSGTFSLAALLGYCSRSPRRTAACAAAIALGLLAMLSKPSAVTVPLAALALDRLILKRDWRGSLIPVLAWVAALAPFALIAAHVQPTPPEFGGPVWARFFVMGDALAFYAAKLVCPVDLGVDYGRTPGVVISHWWGYCTWLVPAIIAWAALTQRRGRPWLLAGVCISFVSLLPVLGLTPFIFQQFTTVADRYLYFALLGPAIVAAFSLSEWTSAPDRPAWRVKTIAGAAVLVLALLFLLTQRQTQTWDDSVTAMTQAVRVNPRSFNGQLNLGSALLARGKGEEAAVHLRAAVAFKPGSVKAKSALGLCLLQLGETRDAISQLRDVIAAAPGDAAAHNALGLAYLVSGQPDLSIPEFQTAIALQPGARSGAIAAYRQALAIDPLLIPVYSRLGDALSAAGRAPDAITAYAEEVRRDPSSMQAYEGIIRTDLKIGDRAAAERALTTALSYHPSDNDARALRAALDQPNTSK
jgi:Flp pilus assembly protein TadD